MSTATTTLETDWQTWHSQREQDLATPHGWLSLTAFHWLPATPSTLGGLPGQFWVRDGQAVLTAGSADGYAVIGSRNPVDGTVGATVAEARSLEWLRRGEVVVELARRGGRYAIRTRDPQAPARLALTGVPTFPLDEKWLVTAHYEPFGEPRRIEVATARDDLRQSITGVGTVTLVLDGRLFELTATAGADGVMNVPFHDRTNGESTALWRSVGTSVPDADGRVQIDFNRAVNFPFAFSDFGTCPAPPAGNVIDLAIAAGERTPAGR